MRSYSVILPVRNGGAYAKECINSIRAQTYPHFNLVVLDNNSSDDTVAWIASLNDERIIVHRVNEPLSIEQNWARIVQTPAHEFITLIGHDDILDPDFLLVMDELIGKYPDAGLYHAHFRYIDPAGKIIRRSKPMAEKQSPAALLVNFLSAQMDICGTGYVMRKKDYDEVGGIPPYPRLLFADFELWINLARKNYLAVAGKECFAFRLHQSTTTSSSDLVMLEAFERFIGYLNGLEQSSPQFNIIIHEQAARFLDFYCQGLSSRLLRTPKQARGGLRVKDIVNRFNGYARRLGIEGFDPLRNKVTRTALFVDSNMLTRNLFLLFKKMYSKPVIN